MSATVLDPAVGPADRTPIPAARSIRGYTAAVARQRADAGMMTLLGDVYYSVIMVGIGVLIALGALQQLPVVDPPGGPVGLSLDALARPVLMVAAGAVVSLAGRLGPVGVGGAEAQWWLSLPVDRRGLLTPSARRVPVVAALAGALVAGVLDAALAGSASRALRVGIGVGLAAALLVGSAALVQSWRGSRVVAQGGDALMVLGAVSAVAVLALGWQPSGAVDVPWWVSGVLVVLLGAVGALVTTRLDRIPARSLRDSGAVAAQATGALVSFDSRELGRALTDRIARQERRRSRRMRTVRGPLSALVTSDLLVLVRSPRHLVQLAATALVPVLVVSAPALAGSVQVALAVLFAGGVAMAATTEGARRAELTPGLDRLLPLSANGLRRARLVVPAIVMTVWNLAAFGAVGVWYGSVPLWLALGVLAGPAWAGAALRSAFRPAPRWDLAVVATPAGAVPMGAAAVIARGPDAVVVGLLPAVIAILVGAPLPVLLLAQVVTSAIVLAWGSSTETRSLFERLTDSEAGR
ncbi:DUF6297 family protein [Actinotalea sp. M2MS4P-6]|uniref:DUF6297 family protein n=1 Tax=Actinotalea sp. M2MS4P-6 TaxID=2983762 RepID=UPI0021E40100|nr:DUF6297 family protein [Actinotalea sp. M2MS4P-6]MCV2393984.1 DUF6297 family protein [Actinotalea sp. M2MS4P-6]